VVLVEAAATAAASVREDPQRPVGRGDRRGVEEVVRQRQPLLQLGLVGPQLGHEGPRDEREVRPLVVELQRAVQSVARRRFH
jgi:hypothetical protein